MVTRPRDIRLVLVMVYEQASIYCGIFIYIVPLIIYSSEQILDLEQNTCLEFLFSILFASRKNLIMVVIK